MVFAGGTSDATIFRNDANGSGLHFSAATIMPANATGAVSNGTEDLGSGTQQFKDLYLSGAVNAATVGVTNIVTNKVVKFDGSVLNDSNITDTGSLITLGSNTTVNGVVKHSDGSAAAPSITFTDDTNTGIYSSSNDTLNIGTAGVQRAFFNSAGITSATNVYTGSTASFRNYGGVWSATTGLTGNGFNFINSVDGTAATISSTGSAVFSGTVTATSFTGSGAGLTNLPASGGLALVSSGSISTTNTNTSYLASTNQVGILITRGTNSNRTHKLYNVDNASYKFISGGSANSFETMSFSHNTSQCYIKKGSANTTVQWWFYA